MPAAPSRRAACESACRARRTHRRDVTDIESFAGFLAAVEQEWRCPLDVLVNNAGVMWVGRFDEEPEAAAQRQVEVNLLGVIRGIKLAADTATGAAKTLQPVDVARVVVEGIRRPRFEVAVPGYVDPLNRVVNLLPRSLRDVVFRRLVPNQVKNGPIGVRAP